MFKIEGEKKTYYLSVVKEGRFQYGLFNITKFDWSYMSMQITKKDKNYKRKNRNLFAPKHKILMAGLKVC